MDPVGPNHPVTTTSLVAAAREARREDTPSPKTTAKPKPAAPVGNARAVPPADQARVALTSLHDQVRRLEHADHVAAVADAALGEITERLIEAEVIAVATTAREEARREAREKERRELARARDDVNDTAKRAAFGGKPLLDGSLTIEVGDDELEVEAVAVPPVKPGEDGRATLAATRAEVTALRAEIGTAREGVRPRLDAVEQELAQTTGTTEPIPDTQAARATASVARAEMLSGSSADSAALAASDASDVLRLLA